MKRKKGNDLNFSGQHNLLDPKTTRPVTLIGAGSIGSHVAYALAKMGVPQLVVWDDDDVSEHNIPMSLYRPKDHMRPKVEALRDILKEAAGLTIETRHAKYEGQEPIIGTLVVCVDTMDARRKIWERVRMNPEVDLLIDTRTAAKLLWVFAVNPCDPEDVALYDLKTSYATREAAPHMCGKHGFMPMSFAAAGKVAENLTTWWMSGIKKRHHAEMVAQNDTNQEDV